MRINFSTAADGSLTEGLTEIANLHNTELTLASKDVLVVSSHGVRVLNGARATSMK